MDKQSFKDWLSQPQPVATNWRNEAAVKRGPPPPPITPLRISPNGTVTGRKNVDKHVLYHFANTGKFYTLAEIRATIDPTISRHSFYSVIGNMKKRAHAIRVETRQGAKSIDSYRFSTKITKDDKLISLAEIETRFTPLIDDLLKQATLPVSHQSSDRFRVAANTLRALIKEWRG
jgi:hypothetical protein